MVTYFTAPAWVSGSSDVEIITSIRLLCAYSPYRLLKISYDTDKENLMHGLHDLLSLHYLLGLHGLQSAF